MHENPWIVRKENRVYANPWITLTEFEVINPSGKEGIYGKVHFKNIAVGVIAVDEDMHTYLVGQYRFPLQAYSWEIPEGGALLGTDPLEEAKRELKEETGLVAARWEWLMEMHLSNSVSDELAVIFLARDLTQGEASPEETEKLLIKRVPFEEAWNMVKMGTITDSISVAAIMKIKLLLAEGIWK